MILFTDTGILIFGFKVAYYGLLIALGGLSAAILATRSAKRRGLNPTIVWDVLPWLLIAGLIGARIWHVLTPSASALIDGRNPYFLDPSRIWDFKHGGLGIPGAVIGGVITLWIYTRVKKINFSTWLDIGAPSMALAQAIGRWGNFINQEIYGLPTTATMFPFAIYIDPAHRLPQHMNDAYYLPVFFYESLWNLLNMCILLWLPRKFGARMKPGDNFLVYLIVYPVGRFLLEFIRLEYSPVAGININQTIMAVTAVGAAIALILRHGKNTDQPLIV